MHQLLIATQNGNKVREFKDLLRIYLPKLKIDLFTLKDFPGFTPSPEVGESFEAIASAKALEAATFSGLLTLADDSGLMVPALGGRPGLLSARYAGPEASDRANREKLIGEIATLPESERHAYFVAAVAIARPGRLIRVTTGRCEGQLSASERGAHGFGYDALFQRYDYDKTFAELEPEIKARTGHRGKAFHLLVETLEHEMLAQ